MAPMIIDIILVQETPDSSSDHSSVLRASTDTVIGRWVVQYEHLRAMAPHAGDASDRKLYKNSIIRLRSLYSMLRLLPAYKVFWKLSSLTQTDFDIKYKVSLFSDPFSRAEEDLMKQYNFVPVEAQQGRFAISVTYRESLTGFNLETSASFPPEIITDYVRTWKLYRVIASASQASRKGKASTL